MKIFVATVLGFWLVFPSVFVAAIRGPVPTAQLVPGQRRPDFGHTGVVAPASRVSRGAVTNYSWLLDRHVFSKLSSGGQRAALEAGGLVPEGPHIQTARQTGPFRAIGTGVPFENLRLNDPALDTTNPTESETSIAVDATNSNNIAVSFNDIQDDTDGYAVSTDGGRSFAQGAIPEPARGQTLGDGVVAFGPSGELYYSTLALVVLSQRKHKMKSLVSVAKSTDHGRTFTQPVDATGPAGNKTDFQDKEWIAVDSHPGSRFKGNVYLSWTNFPRGGSEHIDFCRSTDGGQSFEDPIALPTATNLIVVQGSVPVVGPSGELYVLYAGQDAQSSRIVILKSTDGGQTFGAPVDVARFRPYGAGLFGSPATLTGGPGGVRTNFFPSVAIDGRGAINVVFAARSLAPTTVPDRSNIFFTRSTDGGISFSTPVQLNDDGTTTTQCFPSVAVTAGGAIGVKWWDRRNDPARDVMTDVYMTMSFDGGATFSKNFRVTDHNWMPNRVMPPVNPTYHGDYDGITAAGETFLLSWSDERSTDPDVYFTTVPSNINTTSPDFNISASKLYDAVVSGNSVSFTMTTTGSNGPPPSLAFNASPSIDGLAYSFSSPATPGQPVTFTIATSPSTAPGNYLIAVGGTLTGGPAVPGPLMTRRTNIAITVFGPGRTAATPVNATNTSGYTNAGRSQVAVDQSGTVHLVYDDDAAFADGGVNAHLFYTQSSDGGRTFTAPVQIDSGSGTQEQPVPDDDKPSGDDDLPDGYSATSPLLVQNTGFRPTISVDPSGTIYIMSRNVEFKTGELDTALLVRRSTDGGKSFSSPTVAATAVSVDNSFTENDCQIGAWTTGIDKNGNILIALYELCPVKKGNHLIINRVHVIRSTDHGQTFSPPRQILLDTDALDGLFFDLPLRIAFDSKGAAYVLQLVDRTIFPDQPPEGNAVFDVVLAIAPDGQNFTRRTEIIAMPTPAGVVSDFSNSTPDLLVDPEDNVLVAVQELDPTKGSIAGDIFLFRSTDGGGSFGSPVQITNNLDAIEPVLILQSGQIGLMYTRLSLGSIVLTTSADGGRTFGQAQDLSGSLPSIWFRPGIVSNQAGTAFAIWDTTAAGSTEVFVCKVH